MAVVEPKSLYAVNINEPQAAYFSVDVAMAGYLDTETVNGGRMSPCAANDFATKPTTLAQSLLVSRGQLRFKMMMENLQLRTNVQLVNMVTTYSADAGDNPITDINFGLVFPDRNLVADTGTSSISDSTTINTRVLFIKDRIFDALNSTRTEKMSVFNPTSGTGQIQDAEVTAGPVLLVSKGEILEGITVAEVTGFALNTSNQLPTDSAQSYATDDTV